MPATMPYARLLLMVTAAVSASPPSAAAQAVVAGKPALPPVIAKAFHEAWPKAKILAWSREKEKGRTIYEVESRDGTVRRDLIYAATGQTIAIEETVPASEVPETIRSALSAAAPSAIITRAERVTRDSLVTWEMAVKVAGKSRSFTFDLAGRLRKP